MLTGFYNDPMAGQYTYSGSRPYTPGSLQTLRPAPPPPSPIPPIVTKIDAQTYDALLYGKDEPLFVGGRAPIGGRIVEGVFWSGTQEDPRASFVCVHARHANPNGICEIRGASLRGKEVAYDGDGYLTSDKFAGTGARVEFRTGRTDQLPCRQSVLRYGAGAIAYIDCIVSSWENIPVALFGGIVPLPTVDIADGNFGDPDDGIILTDALGVVLKYARRKADEFLISVNRVYDAVIIGEATGLTDWLRRLRQLFVRMSINYHDKITITEPDEFSVAVDLTNDNHIAGSLAFTRLDPFQTPREKIAGFINKDRDYEIDHVRAREDLYPVATTASVESESFELALVSSAEQMLADVHLSLFQEEAGRSQFAAALMADQFGAEPGDGVRYAADAELATLGRIAQTDQNFNDWTNTINVVGELICGEDVSAAAVVFGRDGAESAIILESSEVANSAYLSGVTFFNMPSGVAFDGSTLFEFSDESVETGPTVALGGDPLRIIMMLADTDGTQRNWVPADPPNVTKDVWHSLAWSIDVHLPDIEDKVVTVVFDGVALAGSISGFAFGALLKLNGVKVAVPSVFTTLPDSPVRMSRTQIWVGQYIDWNDPDKLAKVVDAANAPVDASVAAAAFGAPTYLFDGSSDTFAPPGFELTGTLDDYTPGPP